MGLDKQYSFEVMMSSGNKQTSWMTRKEIKGLINIDAIQPIREHNGIKIYGIAWSPKPILCFLDDGDIRTAVFRRSGSGFIAYIDGSRLEWS